MAQSMSYETVEKFCLSDLSEVREALFDVRSKWENVGIELLNKNDTDAIKRQHPSLDPVDCLTEMLSIYLKRDYPEPSWDAIIAALRARAVGESRLAEELEQRYIMCTTTPRQTTVEHHTIGEASRLNQDEIVAFPYLDVSKLSLQDRQDLIQKLSRDYTNILKKFAKFEGHVRNSLIRQNISAEGVANCALNLALFKSDDVPRPLLPGELENFEEAKSIDKIFILLKKHQLISYFNYGILKHIVETHGTEVDKCKLKEYEDEFKKFCLHKVHEVPPVISKCTSSTRKIFKVLITTDMSTTLTDVAAAERKIADILGLHHSVLTLHEISPGSLILTLSVPISIVDELFPLKEEHLSELKANGFTILFEDVHWKYMYMEQPENSEIGSVRSKQSNAENSSIVRNILEMPALPSKDVPVPSQGGSRGSLPALPPKEDSPSHVACSPNVNWQPKISVPEKQEPVNKFQKKCIPSLPPKEPERALSQLPPKQPNRSSIPPLPPKETSPPVTQEVEKLLLPLPPKPKSHSPPPGADPGIFQNIRSVVGYHDVNNVKARELLQPHLGTNGYYLLRPSSERKGGVICTICVTNNNKLINYRLFRDPATGKYFIFQHIMFSNIQLLLAYYKTTPINEDINTLLLYPVTEINPRPLSSPSQLNDAEDIYGSVGKLGPLSPATKDDSLIPGLHEYLPKSEIGTVMNNYLSADGWYLLRPSSTSEGQLTLAVTHGGRILNFKINVEGDQFYIAPKKRFNSARALLDYYNTSPIRSKKYGNSKILLLNPIPVDKKQEDMFKLKLEQKVAKKLLKTNLFPDPLPEPWQEHYDERYKRYYYYNPKTQQTSWERPKVPPTTPSSLPTTTTPSQEVKHKLNERSVEDIQKEQMHLAAIQAAIDKHGTFKQSIVRGVFVGPARSGKDTLMKRLLREMPSKKSPSTGVADRVVHIKVEKSSSSSSVMANIEGSAWKRIKKGDEKDTSGAHDAAIDLMLKITPTHIGREAICSSPDQPQDSEADVSSSIDLLGGNQPSSELEHSVEYADFTTVSQLTDTSDSPLEMFKTALKTKGLKDFEEHLDKQVSLYLTNTGGQMEFQELLPLLVSGPSMFFLTFRLDRDLNMPYEIVYEIEVLIGDGTRSKLYKYMSSNTPLDTILQSLASIDAIGTYSFENGERRCDQLTYRVFLIGTHRDILEKNSTTDIESEISKIDKQIKDAVETAAYRKHIIPAGENRLIYAVNNFAEGDKDFHSIRSSVQTAIEAEEFHRLHPSYWLIYSLMLQRLEKHTESLKACFEIAKKCGISEEKELKEALHFLDRRMGVIRYFPEDELKEVVVLDPQVLFDKVTELIVETFIFEHCYLDDSVMKEFKKGIFSLKEFERINHKINPDSVINPKWFADLLQHLRIAAPFSEDGIQKYFFPSALSHVDEKQRKASNSKAVPEPIISPLVVSFKCGYCPIGLTGGLITYLMQAKVNSGEWEFLTNGIFRDQVTFFVCSTADKITLRSFPTHLEITCIPGLGNREQCPVENTCIEVKRLIKEGIEIVTRDMNYVRNVDTKFTFYCTAEKCKESRKHPAKHVGATGKLHCIKDNSSTFDLPKGHHYWMVSSGQGHARYRPPRPPSYPPENETFDRAEDIPDTRTHQLLPLKQAFKTLIPLAYRWYNIGTLLEITDGKLKSIECDKRDTYDCLREMLSSWLKQVDPPPTWSGLAEAVENFDPSIAEKIRNF